jgi:diguanylate cyclase (GGDEF)-like protein/PAS domain S-box-containing protein
MGPKIPNLSRWAADLSGWIVDPSSESAEPERRRSRFLSWLLLTLFLLTVVAFVVELTVNDDKSPRRGEYTILTLGLIVLWAVAYQLNRAGHYGSAAVLTSAAGVLGPWGSIILDPTVQQGDFVPLAYVALSVLVCSMLLSLRAAAVIATIQLSGLVLLPAFGIAASIINWPSLVSFVFFASVLSVVGNFVSRKDLEQIHLQSRLLARSHEQLQSIIDNSTSIIYLKDTRGRYLLINRQYESVFGLTSKETLGKTSADLLPREYAEAAWTHDQQVMRTGVLLETEETITQTDGAHTYFSVRVPLRDSDGELYAVCNLSTDITDRKRMEDALRNQSVRDPLTGLFNRRYMEETLERELRRAARHETQVGVMMVDLDHFKSINDTAGHAGGDAALQQIGVFLRGHLRAGDIACRYGGDEFVLILPEASREATQERAEQLREDAKHLRVEFAGRALPAVTLSIGIAVFPDQGRTSESLMRLADAAMYRAKSLGRDGVVLGP